MIKHPTTYQYLKITQNGFILLYNDLEYYYSGAVSILSNDFMYVDTLCYRHVSMMNLLLNKTSESI